MSPTHKHLPFPNRNPVLLCRQSSRVAAIPSLSKSCHQHHESFKLTSDHHHEQPFVVVVSLYSPPSSDCANNSQVATSSKHEHPPARAILHRPSPSMLSQRPPRAPSSRHVQPPSTTKGENHDQHPTTSSSSQITTNIASSNVTNNHLSATHKPSTCHRWRHPPLLLLPDLPHARWFKLDFCQFTAAWTSSDSRSFRYSCSQRRENPSPLGDSPFLPTE
ncbi:hypothetical protein LR48_Vigan438s000700 [Vigna angularis]|uniref:Uncharacterized protein n=1 Tax=Phaseolus angularis TaxID=3914 RepID=A0A0L9TB01_PHAAN|nr:hypothetical protein LR48_Vigan438s000700 [Vigna angularis]